MASIGDKLIFYEIIFFVASYLISHHLISVDEFVTPLGIEVSNPVAFGNGWEVTGDSENVSNSQDL